MTTLHSSKPLLPLESSASWRDRLATRIDRWMTSPALYQWVLTNPLTRWMVRRRSKQLFEVMAGFVHSQVLLACVRLRLLELVLAQPRTLVELSSLTQLPAAGLQRLLDSAVSMRLLALRGGDRYGLGSLGAPVVAHPGIRDMVEHNATLYEDLRDPLALLRDPDQARMHAYWPYTDHQAGAPQPKAPEAQFARYSALMATSQRFVIDELLAAYPFSEHRCVLDVGGGMGGWVTALARHQPGLQLQLFDLPPVADLAREQIRRQGLAARITAFGGSFTEDPLPTGADLVTLVRVAHDHDDATVLALLRAIQTALPMGGTLLLAEPMAQGDGQASSTDPYFHFYLMAMGSGRLRTPQALGALMTRAGFNHIELAPNPMPLHAQLLVGRKTKCFPSDSTRCVHLD
ncbi:methyltransferase [Hydrogenophaga sp.]|uniref:methyltransferase n=1 Tax=Hydrogenophaga sp. TaxID=1904254 RepID=UPI00271B9793|nr:methyltransferase [Hydrogenophaga sp.]MDO8906716.1 methyltransferase [Hydrogenophaga sp.]